MSWRKELERRVQGGGRSNGSKLTDLPHGDEKWIVYMGERSGLSAVRQFSGRPQRTRTNA